MNAPQVWILFPILLAAGLLAINRRERLTSLAATLASLGLAALAWWLPVKERFALGPWTVTFLDSWTLLGRRFVLDSGERPALVVLYLTAALWFGAARTARVGRFFVPLGLAMVALLTAAIAVDPFLYAALLIEIAVLVSIPFLTRPGSPVGRGVLRYLTFQTLGMPFILFTGWMLSGVESSPGELGLVVKASVIMGLGFAFLLAVFPFYSWIPMLAQEAHPYAAAFVFLLLPGAITFFGLDFLNRFSWLRESAAVFQLLRTAGVLMVVTAGIWAAFQRSLERMLAYALILEIGLSLILIGLGEGEGAGDFLGVFFADLPGRGLGLGVWSLALSIFLARSPSLGFREVQGAAREAPLAASALILAHFSLAGLPLLAGFPARLALLEGLARVSPLSAFWILLGGLGLLAGGLRSLAVLVMGKNEAGWRITESWPQRIYLALGIVGLLILGLFPQWFLPLFADLPRAFQQLAP